MQYKNAIRLAILDLIITLFAAGPTASRSDAEMYPYLSARFSQLVAESYQDQNPAGARSFYRWMDRAYKGMHYRFPGNQRLGLEGLLRSKKRELGRINDAPKRARAEAEVCAYLHKVVKKLVPRFSLDRGFEFSNVVRFGERQCFLQSVLIAGLLQGMGVDAGVVMVSRNTHGEETNNGHAVTLVKLPSGQDIIVDASEPEPFARQQGLFARFGGYRYVVPVYGNRADNILHYKTASGNEEIATASLRPLDFSFIRSQFWYYRGERAKGGLLSTAPTREGLEAAAHSLQTSVRLCPDNPLAVYMLGRTYLAQGRADQAAGQLAQACRLYSRFGWVPAGPKEYLSRTRQQAASR
jgi:hypothetical protein